MASDGGTGTGDGATGGSGGSGDGRAGTDGRFSDVCLTRLVWLIMIGDSQRRETSRLSPGSRATNGRGLPGPLHENTAEAVDGSDAGVWA